MVRREVHTANMYFSGKPACLSIHILADVNSLSYSSSASITVMFCIAAVLQLRSSTCASLPRVRPYHVCVPDVG